MVKVKFSKGIVIPFGKYKGQLLSEVPASYIAFLANETNFTPAKEYLQKLIDAGEVELEQPTTTSPEFKCEGCIFCDKD